MGLAVVACVAGLNAATGPVQLSPEGRAAALAEIAKDRAEAQAWLKGNPQSYLATIARMDFAGRTTLTVGRAADNDIRIDDSTVAAHHLRVTVQGDEFRVVAVDANATFVPPPAAAAPPGAAPAVPPATRDAVLKPSAITIGRFLLRLSHQRYPGLIVFDPKSPRFAEYKGLKYFPPDLAYRFELPLTKNPQSEIVTILSTRGNLRRAERVGWFDLLIAGQPVRFECMRLLEPGIGDDVLEIFFRDGTAGKDSYGLGRYLEVKKLPSGLYLVDFNLAYNPACAYSDHYNCPIPPKVNTTPVPIRAGEMDSHYH